MEAERGNRVRIIDVNMNSTIKATVIEKTSALSGRLDRIEGKFDQVLSEVRKAQPT